MSRFPYVPFFSFYYFLLSLQPLIVVMRFCHFGQKKKVLRDERDDSKGHTVEDDGENVRKNWDKIKMEEEKKNTERREGEKREHLKGLKNKETGIWIKRGGGRRGLQN